ncbi:MAG: Gfo/Idh/MocA family oxidoreductase [Planctomycetes bacterium]|nr:Gfo/Idh/MocA family oxidoreductase [Planctomycetota bacterium]
MALDLTAEQRQLGQANFKTASEDLSRRGFMKTLAAGAAVVPVGAAVYFGYESIKGKPVKAAIIGCGDEGGVLIGEHNPEYLEFVAACDIRPSNRKRIIEGDPKVPLRKGFTKVYGEKYAQEIDKSHFYTDYREMLEKEKDIEAVVIALPLHLHAEVAIECIEKYKKHVLCEKLMARTIPQCREMIDAAKKNNRILSIGHQRHYSMLYAQSLELLNSNVIGDVKHIRALWHRNFSWNWQPEPGMELAMGVQQPYYRDGWTPPILKNDYDALRDKLKGDLKDHRYGYLDIDELIRWRLYERTGGGLMAELGSHQLDAASIFLGKVHPIAVQGVGTRSLFGAPGQKPFRNNREIKDHIFVTFEFPGKNHPRGPNKGTDDSDVVVVTYSSISTNGFEQYGECVMGSRGTLLVEGEQSAMLFKENEPGKKPAPPRTTTLSVQTAGAGTPALASGSTWGGPPAGAAAAASVGGPAGSGPISRGYKEEMEDFAYCIRRWDPNIGYKTEKKDGKDVYIQRLPRCHGEVAMADAIIALTANQAMATGERIPFTDDHFSSKLDAPLPGTQKKG